MRKLILALFIILSCSSLANSGGVISFPGGGVPNAACAAPAWYNQTGITVTSGAGTVVFAWEGNVSGSNSSAYNNSCTEIVGTLTGGDIGTYQSKTALRIDAADEYITFTQTARQYFSDVDDQTICVEAYISAVPDNKAVSLFLGSTNTGNDDSFVLNKALSTDLESRWYSQTGTDYAMAGGTTPYAAWKAFAGSFDETGNLLGVGIADQTPWLNGYDAGGRDIVAFTDGSDRIYIGNNSTKTPNTSDGIPGVDVYISKVAIISGYLADCSELTGW